MTTGYKKFRVQHGAVPIFDTIEEAYSYIDSNCTAGENIVIETIIIAVKQAEA